MIEKLLNTKICQNSPIDLEQKWNKWLDELNQVKNNVEIINQVDTEYGKEINFYFDSIFDTKIYTRLYLSNDSVKTKKPLIVFFHGSMGPMDMEWTRYDCLKWVKEEGFSLVIFDARNQNGHTIDDNDFEFKGDYYLNHGILNLETNYCKRLYLDGVKLINLIKDPNIEIFKDFHNIPLISLGGSQGGEMSLAVAALTDDISLCVPDIPSGCCIKERIINKNGKYNSVNDLKEKYNEIDLEAIYKDFGYFDLLNLVHKIKCPVFSCVGFADQICPPEYYYKAYEKINTPKVLYIYDKFGHGGFDHLHRPKKIKYIKEFFNIKE